MAHVILETPFREIHGKLSKRDKIIIRQKKYRDEDGRVLFEGKQEAYAVKHPRNFDKTPPQGAELARHNRWTEACQRAGQILCASKGEEEYNLYLRELQFMRKPVFYTYDEALALYTDYKKRFNAQLPNTRGNHPDTQAPTDAKKGTQKRYTHFASFIRALIFHNPTTTP